jgi:hypothetical protein
MDNGISSSIGSPSGDAVKFVVNPIEEVLGGMAEMLKLSDV